MGNNWSEAQYIIDELKAALGPLEPGQAVFDKPGSYTFTVPAKCTKIYIEAISASSGGGGGGGGLVAEEDVNPTIVSQVQAEVEALEAA